MSAVDSDQDNGVGTNLKPGELSVQQLATALEMVNGLFCIYDIDGNVLYMHRDFMELMGIAPPDLANLNIVDLAIDRHKQPIRERLHSRMALGGVSKWELPLQDHKGNEYFVIARTSSWYQNRKIAGEILLVEDISELKRTESQLREFQRHLADTIESLPDATVVVDREGRIVFWNRAMVEMTGYPASDMIGKGNHEYTIPFYGYRRPALLDYILDPSTNIDKEYGYIRRDGNVWYVETKIEKLKGREAYIWARATPLYDTKGDIFGAIEIVRDVTERKREEEELKASHQRLAAIFDGTVKALAVTTEKRDQYTAGHQLRVTTLACAMAQEMGLGDKVIEDLRIAGTLHDIGKLYVPLDILSQPGPLTSIQREYVQIHPEAGYDILKNVPFARPLAEMIRQHHERLDGSGYPRGLNSGEIMLEAKLLAVADVVEAISSHRPYRAALGMEKALQEIQNNAGQLYEEDAVRACVKLITEKGFEFPSGF